MTDFRAVAKNLIVVAGMIGLVGLMGWVLGIDALKRVHPALVTMKVNAAFCLIVAAISAGLLRDRKVSGGKLRLAQGCAGAVFVVGLLTFAEHLGGWDLHIDQLLFIESTTEAGQSFPGRMGPASAFNFVLLGGALLLLDRRTRRGYWPAQFCTVAALAITLFVFIGYFYGLERQGPLARYTSIALHTVIAFLCLCAALLMMRPERGIMVPILGRTIGAIAARRMLPVAAIAPAVLGWLCAWGQNAGWWGYATGTALLVTTLVFAFALVIWRTTVDLDRAGESRYQLAAIVDSSEDAIMSKNLEGVVMSWNASAERLFGYSPAEMIGQPITRIIPVERQAEETTILARIRAGDRVEHFETVRQAKDGRLLDVSLTISPIRDSNGTIIGASKISRDISGQKRLQEALEEERQWLSVTLSSIGDAVIATDMAGAVKFLNPVAETMTGWPSSEAQGRPLHVVFNIVNEYTRAPAPNPVARVIREGVIVGLANHTALISRDGHETSIEDSAAPIKDSSGALVGAVMVFHDVTERRRSEGALRVARDAAEAANRAKDEFLAALSHELRTPLTPVLMLAGEMERSEALPPDIRKDFEMIHKNIELEARLIDDLLDLTRITRGKLALRFGQADVHLLIGHALDILGNEIRMKDLRVETHLDAPEHTVSADAVRLQQVFWNILKNAVKFTGQGGEICILSLNGSGRLVISVRDTGLGITPDEMPRIFDAFAQGGQASEAKFGGLGLGLSISALLVREHGGRIWAESAGRNEGATFYVELPVMPISAAAPNNPMPNAPITTRCFKVLLVEDDETTRATMERLFTAHGYDVVPARCVAQALELAGSTKVDVVVSDLGLPDGNGNQLMRTLRSKYGLPGIALSGYGMQADVEESKRAGFEEHFTKPVDISDLEAAMHRIVSKQ